MNEKFPNPIESISNINKLLNEIKNNPERLKEYYEKACTIINKDEKSYLGSGEVMKVIVKVVAEEKGLVIDLPPFDSQKFKNNYLGLDLDCIYSIKIKVASMNIVRNKDVSQKPNPEEVNPKPADVKTGDLITKLEDVAPSVNSGDVGVKEKKSKWISGADEATKKFE